MRLSENATARLAARWLVTALLMALVVWSVDGRALWQELSRISPLVVLPVLVLTVLQVALSAWRWRYTVQQLGMSLPLGTAIREYYLATFLNQILPGGVLGDVHRAWRQGRASGQRLAAVHGVAIERLSGQLVLAVVVMLSLIWLFHSGQLVFWPKTGNLLWWLAGGVALPLVAWMVFRRGLAGYFQHLRQDLFRALLCWPALPLQLGSSLLVLASYLGVFLCLAWGAGYLGSIEEAVLLGALASLLLLSMLIPVTVAGWGIREATAGVIWPLAGLPAEQGVALSVGYGALILVSSLPGMAGVFVRRPRLA